MEETKMTKIEVLNLIAEKCADNAQIVAYCTNEVASLEKKAAKAKERAAAKKAEGDELYSEVIAKVGEELVTADYIYSTYFADYEDLSIAKIRARLTQGVNNGVLVKEEMKVEGGKKKVHYKVA